MTEPYGNLTFLVHDSVLEIIPLPYMRKQRIRMFGGNPLGKPSRRGKLAVPRGSESSLCWIEKLSTPYDPDGDLLASQRAPAPSQEVEDEGLVFAPAALPASVDSGEQVSLSLCFSQFLYDAVCEDIEI